jgi:hypothetical protein
MTRNQASQSFMGFNARGSYAFLDIAASRLSIAGVRGFIHDILPPLQQGCPGADLDSTNSRADRAIHEPGRVFRFLRPRALQCHL